MCGMWPSVPHDQNILERSAMSFMWPLKPTFNIYVVIKNIPLHFRQSITHNIMNSYIITRMFKV